MMTLVTGCFGRALLDYRARRAARCRLDADCDASPTTRYRKDTHAVPPHCRQHIVCRRSTRDDARRCHFSFASRKARRKKFASFRYSVSAYAPARTKNTGCAKDVGVRRSLLLRAIDSITTHGGIDVDEPASLQRDRLSPYLISLPYFIAVDAFLHDTPHDRRRWR